MLPRTRRFLHRSLIELSIRAANPWRPRQWGGSPTRPARQPAVVVLLVYRRKNASRVERLLGRVGVVADVRLWALDDVAPSLATATVGQGPGAKFELLNRLLAARPVDPSAYVVVADDDVVLVAGTVVRLVAVMEQAALDFAAPGHTWFSYRWIPVTQRRLLDRAHRTRMVEIGPIFVVAPGWRNRVMPFPDDVQMGWSLQFDWVDLQRRGCAFGVVDTVAMVHCMPAGFAYDAAAERARSEARSTELRVTREEWEECRAWAEDWRRWRPVPSWGLSPGPSEDPVADGWRVGPPAVTQ